MTLKAGVAQVSQYNGNSQLSGVTDADVQVVSQNNEVAPVTVAAADLINYLGMPVIVENATVAEGGVWCTSDKHGNHTFTAAGTEFSVYVNKRATVFQGVEYVAATGNISGIAVTYKGNLQLAPRDMEDVKAFAKTGDVEPADPWETAAVAVNGADATDDTRLKELRAYADADYLYVRLTATKETPFGADCLDFFFTDGEGEKAVWWGWTTTGTDIYYQEHKCELNTETGALTKMRWYPVEGDRVYIDDYSTDISDTEVCWTIKFPRSYVDVYKSSTNKTYMSFLLWNGWDSYWAIPARGNAMLEVTLP